MRVKNGMFQLHKALPVLMTPSLSCSPKLNSPRATRNDGRRKNCAYFHLNKLDFHSWFSASISVSKHLLPIGLLACGDGGLVLVCVAQGLVCLHFESVITRTGSKLCVLFEIYLRTDTFMVLHRDDTGGMLSSQFVCLQKKPYQA